LSVVSAAFGYCCKPQIVRDGFGNEVEVLLLDSAPAVCTQPKEVARLTELPESAPSVGTAGTSSISACMEF
jgi:hypothetical protein